MGGKLNTVITKNDAEVFSVLFRILYNCFQHLRRYHQNILENASCVPKLLYALKTPFLLKINDLIRYSDKTILFRTKFIHEQVAIGKYNINIALDHDN